MELRAELEGCVLELLARAQAEGSVTVSLNAVAEALGARRVTPPEIEAIFSRLEGSGLGVTSTPVSGLLPLLALVVGAARQRRERREAITPRVLAEALGVPEGEVRAALLLARTLA
jgi:MYXO-CTERM domain-containing protein